MAGPGVRTIEQDFSFSVQTISSNNTGYVGLFRWGPAEEIVENIQTESDIVNTFFEPDTQTSLYFHSAANYLLYASPLSLVRVVGSGALNAVPTLETPILLKNLVSYENATLTGLSFVGKYSGALGNSLKVSVANSVGFGTWAYKDEFSYTPSSATEFNLVVIDEDGDISGTAGTILERFELLSSVAGTTKVDGTTAYYVEALKNQSKWVYAGDTAELVFTLGVYETSLQGGADDNVTANVTFSTGYNLFANKETSDIMRVFLSGAGTTATGLAIDMCESRSDCVAFHAPELSDVYNVNQSTATSNVNTYFTTTINKNNSYHFQVDNWKLVRDKYNDTNIWIPTDSDAAGLHARLFNLSEGFFSPAGFNRGQLKNVIKLAWNSGESHRSTLYKNGINSIVSFKGEGTVLFGDATGYLAPSAFNRINVRTLFIILKKAIARFARYQLFELNDEITRSLFKNATDRYLDDIKSRRGLYDKLVICDGTNNTAQVIDNNEFVGDILLKPTKSINNIILKFSAVATGVDFVEIETQFVI